MRRTSSPGSVDRPSPASVPAPGHEALVVAVEQAVELAGHARARAGGGQPRSSPTAALGVRGRGHDAGPLDDGCRPGSGVTRGATTVRDDALDDVLGVDAVGERLVGEQHAVAQHVAGDVVDVLRQHVAAAAEQRERASGGDEAERGTRAARRAR